MHQTDIRNWILNIETYQIKKNGGLRLSNNNWVLTVNVLQPGIELLHSEQKNIPVWLCTVCLSNTFLQEINVRCPHSVGVKVEWMTDDWWVDWDIDGLPAWGLAGLSTNWLNINWQPIQMDRTASFLCAQMCLNVSDHRTSFWTNELSGV